MRIFKTILTSLLLAVTMTAMMLIPATILYNRVVAEMFEIALMTDGTDEEQNAGDTGDVKEDSGLDIVAKGLTILGSVKAKEKYDLPSFSTELAAAQKVNFETQAWLNIPNTDISYPIPINTTRKNTDGSLNNEWYLTRALDGSYAGNFDERSVVFADSRNSLRSKKELSQNTILYGHNWTNVESGGSKLKVADKKDKMFAQLPSFADINFAKKTQYFTLDIDDEQLVFVVFAAMYVDTYNPGHKEGFYYLGTDQSDAEFSLMLEEARSRSEHLYKVPVNTKDKIVTLSTCTLKYGSNNNQRFAVLGRLLRDDEDITDFPEPISNPLPKRPNV